MTIIKRKLTRKITKTCIWVLFIHYEGDKEWQEWLISSPSGTLTYDTGYIVEIKCRGNSKHIPKKIVDEYRKHEKNNKNYWIDKINNYKAYKIVDIN